MQSFFFKTVVASLSFAKSCVINYQNFYPSESQAQEINYLAASSGVSLVIPAKAGIQEHI